MTTRFHATMMPGTKTSLNAVRLGAGLLLCLFLIESFNPIVAMAASPPSCTPGNGVFTACFYSGTAFNKLLLERQDPQINFDWAWGSPYNGGPSDQFSVRWEGDFSFSAADY